MILAHIGRLAEKSITAIIFGLVCAVTASYFGHSEIFDPLIMAVVAILFFCFRKDINLFTLLGILIVDQIIEEVTWVTFSDGLFTKIPLYLSMLCIVPVISQGRLKAYLLAFVGLAVIAEIYWYLSGYAPVPGIYWQVWMVTLTATAMRAINLRVHWFIDLLEDERLAQIRLDYYMSLVQFWLIGFYSLITFEYYVRHIWGFGTITIIYDLRPIIGNTLSVFTIYMITVESIKHLRKSELPA